VLERPALVINPFGLDFIILSGSAESQWASKTHPNGYLQLECMLLQAKVASDNS